MMMPATEQQKRKLLSDLKMLKRYNPRKWLETVKSLHDMAGGGDGRVDSRGNSMRTISYRNWQDEDFVKVLIELGERKKNEKESTKNNEIKFELQSKTEVVDEQKEFIIIEGIEAEIVGRFDGKIDLKYENYLDPIIGDLSKTDAIKENKQDCIDLYGLVSKKQEGVSFESKMKIAVVTSAWKAQDYIEQLLDSIENNTMHPSIVLMGIDACHETRDSLNKILDSKKYSFEIKSCFSEENVGTYNIRNNLNDKAFNEYDCEAIVCVDSDDMIHSEYIRIMHDTLLKNKNCIVAPNLIFNFKHEDGKKRSMLNYCTGVNCFSKEVWKKIGYYLPIRAAADNEWIYRSLKLHQKIIVSNSLLYYRRMHQKQLTKIFPVVKENPERIKADNISHSDKILRPRIKAINFENKNFINEYFDQVYCLNLDRRPDRMERMRKRFDHFGIRFERIAAVDGKTMSDSEYKKHKMYKKKLSKGELACTLGHQRIYKDALEKGYERILVFEDDARFVSNFLDRIQEITKFDWNLVLLTGNQQKIPEVVNGFYRVNDYTWSTGAYAINNKCYKKILKYMDNKGFYVADGYWGEYAKECKNSFVYFPNICTMEVVNSDLRPDRNQEDFDKKVGWNLIKEKLI
jgi:GR25 family glycosyltransferase involved in LPS biosynthesis